MSHIFASSSSTLHFTAVYCSLKLNYSVDHYCQLCQKHFEMDFAQGDQVAISLALDADE